METTWKHQVTPMFPPSFHSGNSKIPCGFLRKETPYAPVSGIPLHGNHVETWGFPHGNQEETTWKPRFPKGNMRKTTRKPGFPKVNIRETTWKPHISDRFPYDRKLLRSGFQDSPMWKPKGNFRFPIRKSVGNHMETPRFQQVFPR